MMRPRLRNSNFVESVVTRRLTSGCDLISRILCLLNLKSNRKFWITNWGIENHALVKRNFPHVNCPYSSDVVGALLPNVSCDLRSTLYTFCGKKLGVFLWGDTRNEWLEKEGEIEKEKCWLNVGCASYFILDEHFEFLFLFWRSKSPRWHRRKIWCLL